MNDVLARSHGAAGAKRRRGGSRTLAIVAMAIAATLPFARVAPATAAGLDVSTWGALLEAHTHAVEDLAGTRVDYVALARDPAWRAFVDGLATTQPPRSEAGRMAFWIDVYNALAIDTVVRNWPVESIRDAGSFFRPVWGKDAGRIAGRVVTLHEIEHEILRPMGDPRIHMAIVCASLSCPSLARTPFSSPATADDPDGSAALDARLDAALRRFIGDPRKGVAIDPEAGTLTLSRIFDWFDEDFDAVGGVREFLLAHIDEVDSIPAADRSWLQSSRSKIRVEHFDYDWSVNALTR